MPERPSLRERVPTPQCPYHPLFDRVEFVAWQEGFGTGARFMSDMTAALEEDEELEMSGRERGRG
jgi:hypothetical protein